MEFVVSPLVSDDFDAVLALWGSVEGIGLNETDTPQGFRRFLDRNPGLSLAARDGEGRIVGAALCGFDGRRGYLHHLAVDPRWRRKGVGRAIALRCLELLRGQGIERCNLFVFDANDSAIAFWRSLGWEAKDWRIMQRATDGEV